VIGVRVAYTCGVGERTSGTLHDLLRAKRAELIASWSGKVRATAASTGLLQVELLDQMPAFVDEIIVALYPADISPPPTSDSAEEHGAQRLRLGFDVAEVVREYGLLHGCIVQLAEEAGLTVSARDQAVVANWLNSGIADALSRYVKQRDLELERASAEHLAFIAHELRSPMTTARLAFHRLRRRELAAGGSTVDMLERSLRRTGEMIEGALMHSSLNLGIVPKLERVQVAAFLHDIENDAGIEAEARRITLVVSVPEDLILDADPRLLRSALSNLVFNALKFSRDGSTVTIDARSAEGRVVIQVVDACGGLPLGKTEELFKPFVQRDEDRSGYGLGLAIARQAVEAHKGTLTVHDVPGTGCVFSIALPPAGPSQPIAPGGSS